MTETNYNYVDGEWTVADTEKTFLVHNPANPSDVVGEFQQSASTAAVAS